MQATDFERYFLKLSYDGTGYHGWQVQENAHTVQQEIERAMSRLFRSRIAITGCGRTDTGVHAKTYYAHFDVSKLPLHTEEVVYRLNRMLPRDIAILSCQRVPDDAHARFSACSRTYQYFLHRLKDPFLLNKSYYYPWMLNIEQMNHAAQLLLGNGDFTSFSKAHTQVKTNRCEVTLAYWEELDASLVFTIKADRFLRNMVRAIVGTLIDVGKGKTDALAVETIVQSKNRSEAGNSVPAAGLYLTNVEYPEWVLS